MTLLMLKRTQASYDFERFALAEGEQRSFDIGPTGEYITLLFPAEGRLYMMQERLAEPKRLMVRRNRQEVEAHWNRSDKDITFTFSVRAATEDTLRVSVMDWQKRATVYTIRPGSAPVEDVIAPPLPLGRGHIGMQEGDYVVATETYLALSDAPVYGQTDLRSDGLHMYVRARAGGKDFAFLLDTAAESSAILPQAVPADARRVPNDDVDPTVTLGGTVQPAQEDVILESLELGSMRLENTRMNLMSDVGARITRWPVAGVIGLDLLRRGRHVQISPGIRDGKGDLVFSDAQMEGRLTRLPFAVAHKLIYVRATLNGKPLYCMLDSGMKHSMMAPEAATYYGVEPFGRGPDIAGMEGSRIATQEALLNDIAFGPLGMNIRVLVGRMYVFEHFAISDRALLLGGAFFHGFETVEIDFETNTIGFR